MSYARPLHVHALELERALKASSGMGLRGLCVGQAADLLVKAEVSLEHVPRAVHLADLAFIQIDEQAEGILQLENDGRREPPERARGTRFLMHGSTFRLVIIEVLARASLHHKLRAHSPTRPTGGMGVTVIGGEPRWAVKRVFVDENGRKPGQQLAAALEATRSIARDVSILESLCDRLQRENPTEVARRMREEKVWRQALIAIKRGTATDVDWTRAYQLALVLHTLPHRDVMESASLRGTDLADWIGAVRSQLRYARISI